MDTMRHKIKEVKTLPDKVLQVTFESGEVKMYDVKDLAQKYIEFKSLIEKTLFNRPQLDNDRCDLSWDYQTVLENAELWFNSYDIDDAKSG